ncbi:zinc ribbon domain-containing protein [Zhaonella formicivorans]|uniref:zinc ribbon domain-containing protein n=1 Tax=Zhaonella formicivorans TaxID=2528593 RepID=UPI001D118048|nr:C4-type zinc ribbon domain-containing protein [Zhaonella formicivorans]
MSLAKLWRLQSLYLQQQKLKRQLSAGEGVKLKKEKEIILKRQENLQQRAKQLKSEELLLKQKESEYETLWQKQKAAKEFLYSGQINNPKELSNIQSQLLQMQKDLVAAEEEVLRKADQLETGRQTLAMAQKELNLQKKAFKAEVEHYLQQKKEVEGEIALLQDKIAALCAEIEPELLELYRQNTNEYGFAVLSLVSNKTCSQCHIGIPAVLLKEVRLGQGLVKCENCGRILYWE